MTQAEFNKKGKIAINGDLLNFNNVKLDDGDAEPQAFSLAPVVGYMVKTSSSQPRARIWF